MKAIILAGGGGTRLWPVSRRSTPKQLSAIVGHKTLLRATYDRLRQEFSAADIYIATAASQEAAVRDQLPKLPAGRLIAEPCRRDTASAIGFALLQIARRAPDDTFVIINSDAFVRDDAEYLRVIRAAGNLVAKKPATTILIGLNPSYPETGYGYIKTGALLKRIPVKGKKKDYVFQVERFVEKPSFQTAQEYLAHGGYLWNPTLIIGRVSSFLAHYGLHLPEHARIFDKMRAAFGQPNEAAVVRRLFARLPAISIDYGILEKIKNLAVIPADFGWADIGHWRAVRDIMARSADENVVKGLYVGVDSRGNLVYSYSGKLIATAGICDTIIIETGDVILVCPKDKAQDVKRIVGELERQKKRKYL